MQVLRQKFEDSARERLSSAGEETIPAGRKPEVSWDTDHSVALAQSPDSIMSDASLDIVSHHPGQRLPSRGSKHCLTTRPVREIERLSSQLRDQERVRNSLAVEAAALCQLGTLPVHPADRPSGLTGPAIRFHQGA